MIGVFDSGIGGLTVARALMEQLPGYDIVYFGDTARVPYGNKSPETVTAYAVENVRFLLDQGATLVVAACNTASSLAWGRMNQRFDIPMFEVVAPAAHRAIRVSKSRVIGVIGTRATIASSIYERKITAECPEARVYTNACPLLVPLVEEGWERKPETAMIVKKYLHPLKVRKVDTLILGCTHYPLLSGVIQRKIGSRVRVVDSSIAVAERVKAYLQSHPEVDAGLGRNHRFELFVSDITDQMRKIAGIVLKRRVHLQKAQVFS